MLRAMSWEQLREWRDYAQLEPFGAERTDLGFGIVASTIANANRGKNTRAYKPVDFMPKFDRAMRPAPKAMNAQEFRRAFDGFKEMVKATAGT